MLFPERFTFLRIYTRGQVGRIEAPCFGLTTKVASLAAFEAYLPINLAKRQVCWAQPYPFGIFGALLAHLIDTGECAVYLSMINPKRGEAKANIRARTRGFSGCYEQKYTIIMPTRADGEGQEAAYHAPLRLHQLNLPHLRAAMLLRF